MRKDFACIVISHGRPECSTVKVLRECGYTGKIYIVVDDEDETLPDYIGGVPTFESGKANRAVMNGYFLRTENIFFWSGRYSEDFIADVMCSRNGQAWFRFTPVMNQFDVWLPKKIKNTQAVAFLHIKVKAHSS